ncbi:MAG: hypothetical protein DHS20C17_19800 [Cyclobacteriaceae bacterium]|nr:MAG: hypothetical protein DHS20C17_19800 [Cyclobacteriaceae bacterium]
MNNHGSINRDYIKSYCASYTNNILDTAFKDNPYLFGNDLKQLCNPEQINFNLLRTIFLQWEAEVSKMQNPYFDHEAPSVKNALKAYMEVLSRHIKLDKSSLRPLLQQAVEETIYQVFSPSYFFENLLWPTRMGRMRLSELSKLKKFIRINQGFLKELIDQWEVEKRQEVELEEFRNQISAKAEQWEQWESTSEYALAFSKVVAIHTQSLWNKQKDASSQDVVEDNLKSVNQRFTKEVTSLNDALQKDQITLADKLNKQVDKVDNLKKDLNINQKYRFINELYGGNSIEFNQVLDLVDQCSSYTEAIEVLDQKSSLRMQWNMEGEAVKEFITVVSKRFSEPGPAYDEHPSSIK